MSSLLYLEGNIGYTFPGTNTELWYRGKVYADRQGRYFESKTTIATYVSWFNHDGCQRKPDFVCRYSFKATYPRRYDGRPIIHYHYKVSLKRKRKNIKNTF